MRCTNELGPGIPPNSQTLRISHQKNNSPSISAKHNQNLHPTNTRVEEDTFFVHRSSTTVHPRSMTDPSRPAHICLKPETSGINGKIRNYSSPSTTLRAFPSAISATFTANNEVATQRRIGIYQHPPCKPKSPIPPTSPSPTKKSPGDSS